MISLILIAGTLFLGSLTKRIYPEPIAKLLPFANFWCLKIALPALILVKMRTLFLRTDFQFNSSESLLLISMPWIHAFISTLSLFSIGRILSWKKSTTGALMLTVGLGNTSFVGFPLLRTLLGEASIPHAILLDQLGSFLILSSVAIPLATLFSPKKSEIHPLKILLKILSFPPLLALLFCYAFPHFSLGQLGEIGVNLISNTLAPVAVFSVGLAINIKEIRQTELRAPLLIGLGLKLLIFPVIYYIFYLHPGLITNAKETSRLVIKTILLEGAMASMITSGIVATENGYDATLAQLMVGLSVLISMMSVPLLSTLI